MSDSMNLQDSIPTPFQFALAIASAIDDIYQVPYPNGVIRPKVRPNTYTQSAKFIYDREFLLQFMPICKEKPFVLTPLNIWLLGPSSQIECPSGRGKQKVHFTSAKVPPNPGHTPTVLGIGSFGNAGTPNPFPATPRTGSTLSRRFTMSNDTRVASAVTSGSAGMSFGGSLPPCQGGPLYHTQIKAAGEGNGNQAPHDLHQRRFSCGGGRQGQGQYDNVALDIVTAHPIASRAPGRSHNTDSDSPEVVERHVRGLLNKLTLTNFDSISDQIIAGVNKSEKDKDGQMLIRVVRLVVESAVDGEPWSAIYARLCRKMMKRISPQVQDDGIKNAAGKPIAGGQLLRKYLLNRIQEDFEHGWSAKDAIATAKADQEAAGQAKYNGKSGQDHEPVLYSDEYYAAQRARRQGLGLVRLMGELFKLQMLTERIMHECVKKFLGNVVNPQEEEIESLCKLLTTVGQILDTNKARAHMDVYFSRMKELTRSPTIRLRLCFMLQDVVDLRDRKWYPRHSIAAIADIHEPAAKERAIAEKEKESYQWHMRMISGGPRRRADRGSFGQQVGSDGWAGAVGSSGPLRPRPKAGDLTNFGKINKSALMTFGPNSVFAGKKDSKERPDPLSRISSLNMFSMLSQNPEMVAGTATSQFSTKTSVDLSQSGVPNAPAQRRKLNLLPRRKGDEEVYGRTMSEADAKKKVDEDSKEFFGIRNLEEAEVYFTNLTDEHRFRLVDKLVTSAIESKKIDAQLVGDFFSRAAYKELCSPDSFEQGFLPTAEILDDIAIDAPKAFDLMAIMMNGADLDKERRIRIAAKSMDSDKLLVLLS